MELEYDDKSLKTLPSHGGDRSPILRGPILLKKMEEEPQLDKELVKKIVKEWKDIDAGRVKLHRYDSLSAFEKALG